MQESLLALENLHLSEFELGTRPRERVRESDGLDGLQCVCYGVGNFSSCVVARYQLAFLMDLLEELQIPRHFCHVFDPVFSDSEIEILNRLGLTVIKENEYQDIFSDTSVHCFSSSKLRDLPLDIWTSLEEPVYREEDLEIIRKEP
ncbi:hypothetical protein JD844_015285 [Phrynosoma platyrhinos]|uniref:SRR1-like domain-containing protein n=1 Tax=Phrynosoma platyrhinos TaxID=52577 RepID=A0ABQ7T7H5_PHRPL|nr:hypothetical protein JD844_015285 [Phrynosoma platyrhinos]